MKRLCLLLGLMLVMLGTAWGQSLPRVADIDAYWPEGEEKVWKFVIGGNEIGRLKAVHDNSGDSFSEIIEELDLDLSRVDLGPTMTIRNQLAVYKSGYLLSADMDVTVGSRSQALTVVFDSTAMQMQATMGTGNQATVPPRPVDKMRFSGDNNMIDQLELALAFQDLAPGKTIILPIFSPQGMYAVDFECSVVGKTAVQYGVFADTVWRIDMVQPARQTIYIDRMHKLVKLEDREQKLVVELVKDPFADRARQKEPKSEGWFSDLIARIPIYALYLLVAVAWLMFLGRDGYTDRWSYGLFVVGGLVYPLIYVTQLPLQQAYATAVLIPAMRAGESIILPGVAPALMSGIIQETLKLAPLLALGLVYRPRAFVLISLGAFLGAGFGFVEASHITGPLYQHGLMSGMAVTERVFSILFHIVTGAMLGYGLARRRTWQFWLIAAALHALGNYLIIFVQLKMLSVGTLEAILGVYDIAILGVMFVLQMRFKAASETKKKGGR